MIPLPKLHELESLTLLEVDLLYPNALESTDRYAHEDEYAVDLDGVLWWLIYWDRKHADIRRWSYWDRGANRWNHL